MYNRKIDFLTKGLDLEKRQIIKEKLERISDMSVNRILEKPKGYITLKRIGYSDEQIEQYEQNIRRYFIEINNYMNDIGRQGLFSDTSDVYKCCREYMDILKERDEAEMEKIMGSSYNNYIPKNILKTIN